MAGLSANNVRSVIELFCKILVDNEISNVRAEALRQGKFDRDVITKTMWNVLYDVVCFLDKTPVTHLNFSEAEQIKFVKMRLQNWGYLAKSFAELNSSMTHGSREVLLALGWVIYTKQFFSEVIRKRISPLHQDLLSFTQKIPVNTATLHSFDLCKELPAKGKLQRQLLLCGKLKLKLRRLYASQQELAQLRDTIHKCTVGVSVQTELNHLTTLEVFLVRYPESLGRMMNIIEEDNRKLKRLLEWKEKEHVFWDWMDSILALRIQEQGSENDPEDETWSKEESVFLDVPSDVGRQISDMRTCVRDFILGHEEKIEALEKLVIAKKASPMDIEIANFHVEKELFELSHQFALYENGKFHILPSEQSDAMQESSVQQSDDISSNIAFSHQKKGQRNQRYIPQTAKYVKACKETEVSKLVQEEISVLQNEVEQLEQELKQSQINNLKRLQSVTEQDSNSICILPRHFKQFLAS